jgi:hypothetical protein
MTPTLGAAVRSRHERSIGMKRPGAKSAASDLTKENCNRVRDGSRHKLAKDLGTPEPDLVMLLGEPEVRLLMHADGVDEREMLEMFDVIRVQLRSSFRNEGDPTRGAINRRLSTWRWHHAA